MARIADILTGQPTSEDELLPLEVDAAVDLLQRPSNQDRVRHLLETNKPLKN